MRVCGGVGGAVYGAVYRYDGQLIDLVAHENYSPEGLVALRRAFPIRPSRESVVARAVLERTVVHVSDVAAEPGTRNQALARATGVRSLLAAPMLREGEPIGVIAVGRREPGTFTSTDVELLKMFSDQAAIALDNARLFTALEARNGELTAALDRQTATSEILRVITQSRTDVQPVFDAIVTRVKRVIGAHSVVLMRIVGEDVHCMAFTPTSPEADAELKSGWPRPLAHSARVVQTALRDGRPAFVSDTESHPADEPRVRELGRRRGYRSALVVPILHEGRAIGAISATRREPGDFSDHEIALLTTFTDQAVIAIENVRLLHELEDKKGQLERELASARVIQLSMVPTDFPVPGPESPVEIHASLLPAREVGGDLYDFFWLDPDTLYFVVADVSDKGAPAALFMARAKTLIRLVATLVPGSGDEAPLPHEIIARVNQELCEDNSFGMFVTLFMGRVRPSSGALSFCNAGHNVPYVVRPGGTVLPLSGARAKPVGVVASFQYTSTTTHLAAGDTLFAFTDGIPESMDGAGAFYEDGRLEATLRTLAGRSPREVVAGVVENVRRFSGDAPPADDIAVIALRRVAEAAVDLTVTNRPGDLEPVVRAMDELGAVHGLPPDGVADVKIALDEVLTNIVTYGYDDEAVHEIHVRLALSRDSLEVEVEDDGLPFDPTTARVLPPTGASVREREAGGLGLHFVRHLVDDVTYVRIGGRNSLRFRKALRRQRQGPDGVPCTTT
jgi:sigma-B regulation protein RsbU (phosphoserine phosphatase)